MKQNVDVSCSEFRWTYGLYCTCCDCRKNAWLSRIFSRTLSFNFQDFPGPKWFSRTFQVLEFSRKKSRTFQEAWESCREVELQSNGSQTAVKSKSNRSRLVVVSIAWSLNETQDPAGWSTACSAVLMRSVHSFSRVHRDYLPAASMHHQHSLQTVRQHFQVRHIFVT